jgi:MFS transporter, DHA2 family, multidrug resistance protein
MIFPGAGAFWLRAGALEIVLDRALNDDWFTSSLIVEVVVVCGLAFVLMIPWEATRRNPTVDVRMVATRQFDACFLTMLATGAILLSPAPPPARPGAVPSR